MRRGSLIVMGVLCACSTKQPTVAHEDAAAPAGVMPDAGTSAPPVEPEKPLSWGTRPPASGPLYPVVDGMCVHGEIRATKGMTLYTYGTSLGHFSRGGHTTWARVTDDGLVRDPVLETSADEEHAGDWAMTGGFRLVGEWPHLGLDSNDNGNRTRSNSSVWQQTEKGWAYLGSTAEKDGEPYYSGLVAHRDWLIAFRHPVNKNGNDGDDWPTPTIRTWPLTAKAAPILGVESLARADFRGGEVTPAGDTLYAFGRQRGAGWDKPGALRVLANGKVSEGSYPSGTRILEARRASILALVEEGDKPTRVVRFDGTQMTTLPFKLGTTAVVGHGVAADGDFWLLDAKNEVHVLHDESVTTTKLPEPKVKLPVDKADHKATMGDALVGVEFGDPYAMNDTGHVFHFENGEWHELEMPRPPFATNGKYQAQSLVMPAKGDLMVNAAYSEKGLGWKTPERYRALLRTRRPKEVLRCNEPANASAGSTGTDFSTAPPVADDSCQTPFVILLRLGSKKEPLFLHDKQGKYPPLRNAIKATKELGDTATMLEVPWGNLQVIGMKAPNMEAARALALNAAKLVKVEFLETRPEIVCGVPPSIDQAISVDVATGKVITEDASAK